MTLKFEHDVKIRADLRKIRAKFEQNSSKIRAKFEQKEAVLTEVRTFSPIPACVWSRVQFSFQEKVFIIFDSYVKKEVDSQHDDF